MILYFNKNGQLLEQLEYGSAPRVGVTAFQIFAYFDDIDISDYSVALIKLRRPDLEGSEYPDLFMVGANITYDSSIEASNYFQVEDNPYRGYVFDFQNVLDGGGHVVLLDTPGMWQATITLVNTAGGTNVIGLVKFNVEGSVSESDDEPTELDYSVITNNIASAIAAKVDKTDVPSWQATLSAAKDALTNINGWYLSNYEAVTGLSYGGHDAMKITRGGADLTEEYARTYMECMTGSKFLPQYDFNKPQNTFLIFEDGTIWKPQFNDGNGGLLLFNVDSPFGGGGGEGMISITCTGIRSLMNTNKLVPGQKYRITDYYCVVIGITGVSSANHQFDIIVTAISTNELSEDAKATWHSVGSGDYFHNNNLNAWDLKYCIGDRDTDTRFGWSSGAFGKGTIYWMRDEFGNEAPYDFKNILFTDGVNYSNAYTFSIYDNGSIRDASLEVGECFNNIIKPYFYNYKYQLNFIVFYSNEHLDCSNNLFAENCNHILLMGDCDDNTFGQYCNLIELYTEGYCNRFGAGCSDIILSIESGHNIFENYCQRIRVGNTCANNYFGNACMNIDIGEYDDANIFDANCHDIFLGDDCCNNTFGSRCQFINFGTSSSTLSSFYCNNIFDNGVSYINLTCSDISASSSNKMQNVHIHLGVQGSSSLNMLSIVVPDRALAYSIDYYATNSTEVFL